MSETYTLTFFWTCLRGAGVFGIDTEVVQLLCHTCGCVADFGRFIVLSVFESWFCDLKVVVGIAHGIMELSLIWIL